MRKTVYLVLALVVALSLVITLGGNAFAHPAARWTGGGSIFNPTSGGAFPPGVRITHGFELYCNAVNEPNNLEINWEGNHFHLTELTRGVCQWVDALGSPDPPPNSPHVNMMEGYGVGRYNGVDGYHIQFGITDRGEPGRNDAFYAKIGTQVDSNGVVIGGFVLFVPFGTGPLSWPKLTFGNQQVHTLQPNRIP